MSAPSKYLTTTEAAERLGLSRSRVQQFVRKGRLRSIRLGQLYVIAEVDLERFRRRPRPTGNLTGRPRRKPAPALDPASAGEAG